jgi:DtxR family Mn-dependent transcriptional regulator
MSDGIAILLAAAGGGLLAWMITPGGRRLMMRWRSDREATLRVRGEDALKHLYEWDMERRPASAETLADAIGISAGETGEVLEALRVRRLIETGPGRVRLTEPGREVALHVLRAHRLWERYLADETGFPAAEWHGRAHHLEHSLTTKQVNDLSARLGHPTRDPHGDPIPTAEGEALGPAGTPLAAAETGRPFRVLHIEDEPEAAFAEIVRRGLYAGMRVQLLDRDPERIRLLADGHEIALPAALAAGVTVFPLPPDSRIARCPGEPLSALARGERGRVVHVTRKCRAPERRRLMDLGILPETLIEVEMDSPSGNLKAYRIRDTLIALRPEQAAMIHVSRVEAEEAAAAGARQ